MSNTPIEIPPLGPLAGDHNDDDGSALDEAFEAMDSGPLAYVGVGTDREDVPITTRLINRQITLDNPPDATNGIYSGVLVLPADPNRTKLQICNRSPALFSIMVSDANDFNIMTTPSIVGNATLILDLSGHTGPLWAAAKSSNGPSVVAVWAVTS